MCWLQLWRHGQSRESARHGLSSGGRAMRGVAVAATTRSAWNRRRGRGMMVATSGHAWVIVRGGVEKLQLRRRGGRRRRQRRREVHRKQGRRRQQILIERRGGGSER